jgi:hypothetical protein
VVVPLDQGQQLGWGPDAVAVAQQPVREAVEAAVVGQTAGVVEQLPDGDADRGVGQDGAHGGLEADPALGDELQHDGRDEGLGDARDAEAGVHRHRRPAAAARAAARVHLERTTGGVEGDHDRGDLGPLPPPVDQLGATVGRRGGRGRRAAGRDRRGEEHDQQHDPAAGRAGSRHRTPPLT